MADKYYGEHWTVSQSLSAKLGIEFQKCQDWEFTQADPSRIESWLDSFDHLELSAAERTLLLSLLVSSYRDGREYGQDVSMHTQRIRRAIDSSSDLRVKMEQLWWQRGDEDDRAFLHDLFGHDAPAT